MDFVKKLFKTDPNASAMEKFVTYIAPVGAVILLVWLYGSCFGIFENGISRAAAKASFLSRVIGVLLLGTSIFWAWWNWSDRITWRINETAASWVLFVLMGLSVAFFCGFWVGVYR